jgi:hypothetical protein
MDYRYETTESLSLFSFQDKLNKKGWCFTQIGEHPNVASCPVCEQLQPREKYLYVEEDACGKYGRNALGEGNWRVPDGLDPARVVFVVDEIDKHKWDKMTLREVFLTNKKIIKCNFCNEPARVVDLGWPEVNYKTRCITHSRSE